MYLAMVLVVKMPGTSSQQKGTADQLLCSVIAQIYGQLIGMISSMDYQYFVIYAVLTPSPIFIEN